MCHAGQKRNNQRWIPQVRPFSATLYTLRRSPAPNQSRSVVLHFRLLSISNLRSVDFILIFLRLFSSITYIGHLKWHAIIVSLKSVLFYSCEFVNLLDPSCTAAVIKYRKIFQICPSLPLPPSHEIGRFSHLTPYRTDY